MMKLCFSDDPLLQADANLGRTLSHYGFSPARIRGIRDDLHDTNKGRSDDEYILSLEIAEESVVVTHLR